jgi:outer membrane protein OmpA-like peptidoglycan-associated protein
MTVKFKLAFLATTALAAGPLMATPSQAQASQPQIIAQAAPQGGFTQEDRRKGPPREAPKGAPAAPRAAPPQGARPAAPPAPHAPTAPRAAPSQAAPPAARPAPPAPPKPPAAQQAPAPKPPAPPPAARQAPKAAPPPAPPAAKQPPTPPAATKQAPTPQTAPETRPGFQQRTAPGTPPPPSRPPAAEQKTTPAPTQPTPPAARQQQPSGAAPTPPAASTTPAAPTTPPAAQRTQPPAPQQGQQQGQQTTPGFAGRPGAPARTAPQVNAPLPPPPPVAERTAAPGSSPQTPRRIEDFRSERRETQQNGRTVITEPGRVIVRDPSGHSFIRHNEEDRFRRGARDFRQERVGNDTRTVVVRPDGTQIITVNDRDGRLLRRIRRDERGREIVIIDNRHHDYHDHRRGGRGGSIAAGVAAGVVAGAIGGYFVSLPPPTVRIPRDRYIVEAEDAPPEVIYDTLMAPPVEQIERPYTLDEVRYSPMVRARMPSIDLDTINFETGSWEIPPDQAAKLQVIAEGINRAIQRNPSEVFLIEGHTDAVGSDVDNLSLSDRRAQSAAELLTQQFQVPPENLVTQGYGEQYMKVQVDGPSRENRRVTVRRITPLLNGGTASAAPPPPRR